MPDYMVKVKGKHIDHTTIPKRVKGRAELITKWKRKGYRLVSAPSPLKAMEIATGQKLKRKN